MEGRKVCIGYKKVINRRLIESKTRLTEPYCVTRIMLFCQTMDRNVCNTVQYNLLYLMMPSFQSSDVYITIQHNIDGAEQ